MQNLHGVEEELIEPLARRQAEDKTQIFFNAMSF